MQVKEKAAKKASLQKVGLLILLILIVLIFINNFTLSLFIKSKDRINVVIYDDKTTFYSFDKTDYSISFAPDLKVFVPGGYGNYRVGALGKLVALENNPDIFKRTFSATVSTVADYYFYPQSDTIYYGGRSGERPFPSLKELFIYSSNASFLDKIYLFFSFLSAKRGDFTSLEPITSIDKGDHAQIFDSSSFAKNYQGYFYQKTYRNEGATVQILYNNNYDSALRISTILDSTGIQVVDLEQTDNKIKNCLIIKQNNNFPKTVSTLAAFFNCGIQVGKTSSSGIILELGKREEQWSTK